MALETHRRLGYVIYTSTKLMQKGEVTITSKCLGILFKLKYCDNAHTFSRLDCLRVRPMSRGKTWLSAGIKGLHFSLNSVGRQILETIKELCVSQHVHFEFYKETGGKKTRSY